MSSCCMDVQWGDVHKWFVTVWASKLVFDFFWLSCCMKNKNVCTTSLCYLWFYVVWMWKLNNQLWTYLESFSCVFFLSSIFVFLYSGKLPVSHYSWTSLFSYVFLRCGLNIWFYQYLYYRVDMSWWAQSPTNTRSVGRLHNVLAMHE